MTFSLICTSQVLFNLLLQSPDDNDKEETDLDDLLGDNLHVLQVCVICKIHHISELIFFNISNHSGNIR
jgi:hypothetical protein